MIKKAIRNLVAFYLDKKFRKNERRNLIEIDTTPFTDEQICEIVFGLIEMRFPELKK